MNLFNASEIFQFAIKIEENGEQFYTAMMTRFDEEEIKHLFSYLAEQERQHKKIFQAMLSEIESYEPPESYPGEYFNYLRAYAEDLIFNLSQLDEEISSINDISPALDAAIGKELDTILYYHEMINTVPKEQTQQIEKIIAEERRHVVRLSEIKRSYQNKEKNKK
ncbi:MAG: ferritin-like domain-containing protein [Candidatus Cloacimonadia bacterium]